MPKLKVDTSVSVFEPIEVEVDGQTLVVGKFGRETARQMADLDARVAQGDLEAAYLRLELLFGKNDAISKLDLAQVGEITRFVAKAMVSPEVQEKNGPKPGGTSLPS